MFGVSLLLMPGNCFAITCVVPMMIDINIYHIQIKFQKRYILYNVKDILSFFDNFVH
jgi:hypothetical protein